MAKNPTPHLPTRRDLTVEAVDAETAKKKGPAVGRSLSSVAVRPIELVKKTPAQLLETASHFIREKREAYLKRRVSELSPAAVVDTFVIMKRMHAVIGSRFKVVEARLEQLFSEMKDIRPGEAGRTLDGTFSAVFQRNKNFEKKVIDRAKLLKLLEKNEIDLRTVESVTPPVPSSRFIDENKVRQLLADDKVTAKELDSVFVFAAVSTENRVQVSSAVDGLIKEFVFDGMSDEN